MFIQIRLPVYVERDKRIRFNEGMISRNTSNISPGVIIIETFYGHELDLEVRFNITQHVLSQDLT